MRIAWLGPTPSDGGGVGYAATMLLRSLAGEGVEVDCFHVSSESDVSPQLRELDGLRLVTHPLRHAGRIPSNSFARFVTGQAAKALTQRALVRELAARHAERPYDLVYQFSQLELLTLRRFRRRLPPIVVHPEVHAAGELRWLIRERRLACFEPRMRQASVLALLSARSALQRRDAQLARLVVAPSAAFAASLRTDYRLAEDRVAVVPNPIDLTRFAPASQSVSRGRPVRLLFVSRLALRKGLELVVELSHRLDDLAGSVVIEIVGDRSLWSDYRPLLAGLNDRVGEYRGSVEPRSLPEVYRGGDALLQPSHYEPFGLTVGEALASGLPVVASSAIGAAEGVDDACCRRFPVGDVQRMEVETRRLIGELRGSTADRLRLTAREEAERLFSTRTVGRSLAGHLAEAAA
jgi:glycosyltransferase involved in cell wall biosynthesis